MECGIVVGYVTLYGKVFETEDTIRYCADVIDMVINKGLVKSGDCDGVLV